ncbi:MAG: 50S ribosomal protein L18 [Bacteroidales bacterium]|nr:50S ribosomal protein L18 [Bacteroidales bacterium]
MTNIKQLITLRKNRISNKIKATSNRVRLTVFKSLKYDYIQIIDDKKHICIGGASTKNISGKNKMEKAKLLGEKIAKILNDNKITSVVFDRRGYKFHGRIKTIVEEIRKQHINL